MESAHQPSNALGSETPHKGILRSGALIKKRPSCYSTSQVRRWLQAIGFPGNWTEDDIDNGRFPTTLENLERILLHQLVTFAYENIPMHYSSHHTMDISPDALFQRLVVERQGSWCFGLNGLLYQMLLGLGYRAYAGGSRINLAPIAVPPNYTDFVHMIILVQPSENSNITYLVDAGCAGSGPARPILLSDADDNMVEGASPTERHRLRRGLYEHTSPGDYGIIWRLEVLHDKPDPPSAVGLWRIVHSFSEDERSQSELERANVSVYTAKQGWFWEKVICSRHFWLDSQDNETDHPSEGLDQGTKYLGRLVIDGDTLKRHIGNRVEVVQTVTSERERARLLSDAFGIRIEEEALAYIAGRAAAL
ncbi:hypothetical protein HGRIS_006231 [Hohenbuehelia grisea]|uniref:Arylamine N-acetyltransferase n=1 Tax=Hohenbuehelia grisea TaxID=104357 RepID=A0ABR3K1G9_9AGAR